MRHPDFAVDFRCSPITSVLGSPGGDHVAMHLAVDPQTAGECHIAVYHGAGANQAIDAFLRCRASCAATWGSPHGITRLRVARGLDCLFEHADGDRVDHRTSGRGCLSADEYRRI
jgi:hypothetical protein